jgi:hypothetical protein
MAAVSEAIQAIRLFATFGHTTGIDHQGLLMGHGDHLRDRGLVGGDKIKASGVPTGKRVFMIGTVTAQIVKGCMARERQQESP